MGPAADGGDRAGLHEADRQHQHGRDRDRRLVGESRYRLARLEDPGNEQDDGDRQGDLVDREAFGDEEGESCEDDGEDDRDFQRQGRLLPGLASAAYRKRPKIAD